MAVAMGKFEVRRWVAGEMGQTIDRLIAVGHFHFRIPFCPVYVAKNFAGTRAQIGPFDRIVVVALGNK